MRLEHESLLMQPEYAPGPIAKINVQYLPAAQVLKAHPVESECILLFHLSSISLSSFCYVVNGGRRH